MMKMYVWNMTRRGLVVQVAAVAEDVDTAKAAVMERVCSDEFEATFYLHNYEETLAQPPVEIPLPLTPGVVEGLWIYYED